ncbi:MAG TPA: cytochrome B [Chryseosolibacter sp.]|jgi:hypothetical protein|nr:cytochrome B [Chryseosolibacter sp.]
MYNALLFVHSYVRYIVLILLIVVIIASAVGLINKKPYSNSDNKLGLSLLIFTHLQFLVGIILYFVSPAVVFSGESMKNSSARYWLVEHAFGMIIAIALITAARVTSKKMSDSQAKYRRLLIFNLIAFLIIVLTISFSGRDFIYFR